MALSKRASAAAMGTMAAVLGGAVIFDIYEDWQVQGDALTLTLAENVLPLALVCLLLYAVYRLYQTVDAPYLATVARWTSVGIVGIVVLGGWVFGLQAVQGAVKPAVLVSHTAIGGAVGGAFVGYTVASLRQARATSEREKRRWESLFANAPTGIADLVLADEGLVVASANDAFAEWFGEGEDEDVEGQTFPSLVPLTDVDADLEQCVASQTVLKADISRPTGDSLRYYKLRFVPYDVDDDDRAYAILTDVTDLKETQRELEETVADLERTNEQLEGFASVVSHDLRNPLTVAMGHLDLIETDDDEAVETVQDALQRMDGLIEDLLALARQGDSVDDPVPVRLDAAARRAWDTAETGDLDLVVDTEATVLADESRLEQLLENLFRNAGEHAGNGVTVTVDALDGEGFAVADDGVGIPESERETVFEPGYTGGEGGTGLGLDIVRDIAEAHGWRVSVSDGPGGGARFEFRGVERV